jgi:acetyl-CoA carboxylase biotin carboxyl carrier protein
VSLTAKDVAEILQLLEGSRFDELDLEINGVKLNLRRSGLAAPVREQRTAPETPQSRPSPVEALVATVAAAPPGTTPVTASLLGIYYRAPKPGEPPYVNEGDRVSPETIIGIIEVMKLMNTVRAGVSGTIAAIPAQNGALVEFGEPLLFVRTD